MTLPLLDHERVLATRGARSGLPIIVAVHSTMRGAALGGCRVWTYPRWEEGLADALQLSAAMTLKCAVAGLPTGGGKTVLALPSGTVLSGADRREALLDIGDAVHSLGGVYRTAEDVGTTSADMLTIRSRTPFVVGMPAEHSGTGEPAGPTSRGVLAGIDATVERMGWGIAGLRVSVLGLGQVGSRIAADLAGRGARVSVADIDPSRARTAREIGAEWVSPEQALLGPADLLIPAGVGGILTSEIVPRLRCAAIVGPANNQLADRSVADALAARGILWVPDFVVNAGGAIATILREVEGESAQATDARVAAIADTVTAVLHSAQAEAITPLEAAEQRAAAQLA